jgi:hypothetical protein
MHYKALKLTAVVSVIVCRCLSFYSQIFVGIQQNDIQQNDILQNDIQQNDMQQNDIQQNDIQQNDIQQNEIQQNDIQQNNIHQNDVKQNDSLINDNLENDFNKTALRRMTFCIMIISRMIHIMALRRKTLRTMAFIGTTLGIML